jgi:hypothetical protein
MKPKQFVYDRLAAHYDGAMRPLERFGLAALRAYGVRAPCGKLNSNLKETA